MKIVCNHSHYHIFVTVKREHRLYVFFDILVLFNANSINSILQRKRLKRFFSLWFDSIIRTNLLNYIIMKTIITVLKKIKELINELGSAAAYSLNR